MKRLSMHLLLVTVILTLSGASFSTKPVPPEAKQTLYYWYMTPYDTYYDRRTTSDEIYEMWIFYGGILIDTQSAGGTLVSRGYLNNVIPHNMFASVYLYAHY